jgi:hypothetical protein
MQQHTAPAEQIAAAWVTRHGSERMEVRGFSPAVIETVLTYGRMVHARGATIYAIGRKEVRRLASEGIDIPPCEGVQVVCSSEGDAILTVYRNHNFRGLRPRQRLRRGRRQFRWAA